MAGIGVRREQAAPSSARKAHPAIRSSRKQSEEELLFRIRRDVVDADLGDYFGSLPHADPLMSVTRRIGARPRAAAPRAAGGSK
jgi:hypothetical protein